MDRKVLRKPNFLFIGAAKTGSSWLYYVMREHPEIYVPDIKDPYFFDRNYQRGTDWYLRLFDRAPDSAKAIGELSHDYLYSLDAPDRIKQDLPGVKLIVCLRNPMEHIISTYMQMAHAGMTRVPLDEAIRTVPELVDEPSYSHYLPAWLDRFDHAQIKIMLFDDLRASPRGFATQVFDFLGVSTPDDIDYARVVNAADFPRSYLVSKVVGRSAHTARRLGLVTLVGRLKQNPIILRTLYRPVAPRERPKLGAAEWERLRPYFREEIRRVAKLIDRDLSRWEAAW